MDIPLLLELCEKHRVFPIVGDITERMIDEMKKTLFSMALSRPDEPIYLLFDTRGGGVSSAKEGYDFIKGLKVKVIGIVVGKCFSSGLILLAGCTKGNRYSFPNSRFLFHAITSGIEIKSTENTKKAVRVFIANHERLVRSTKKIYMEEFDMTQKHLKILMNEGEFHDRKLSADEAMKYRVVDSITTQLPFL